ncbi:MAG: glycosyltransferase family 4 protein [Alphaproteobacteria bacterium]|nr:glycosyltransferase family 4 protein [Alphaproteobacteria bacterium]
MPVERPKLIFLVTEDWYFWSHRLPMARAARDCGFDVAVATRVTAHGDAIRAAGFALHPLRWKRRAIGPMASLAAIWEIARLYRRERPLAVHHVSFKAAVLGGIAARLARVALVVSMANGMGYIGASGDWRARGLRRLARFVFPWTLFAGHGRVIVQNDADRRALAALCPKQAARIVLIPGSGVDLAHFAPLPEPPAPPVTVAYAGRMIAIKGVATLVAAQQRVRAQGIDLNLVLAGDTDDENPSAIDRDTLARWAKQPGVAWLGRRDDIRTVWRDAHIAALASLGGEGVPKSLLEAAAVGRPIVATDVPGMRTIAQPGVNAILVAPNDAAAFADALITLVRDADLRRCLATAGRRLVEQGLSDTAIAEATRQLYRTLLDEIAHA